MSLRPWTQASNRGAISIVLATSLSMLLTTVLLFALPAAPVQAQSDAYEDWSFFVENGTYSVEWEYTPPEYVWCKDDCQYEFLLLSGNLGEYQKQVIGSTSGKAGQVAHFAGSGAVAAGMNPINEVMVAWQWAGSPAISMPNEPSQEAAKYMVSNAENRDLLELAGGFLTTDPVNVCERILDWPGAHTALYLACDSEYRRARASAGMSWDSATMTACGDRLNAWRWAEAAPNPACDEFDAKVYKFALSLRRTMSLAEWSAFMGIEGPPLPPSDPTPGVTTYVALGDSFSSGEGVRPFDSGTDDNVSTPAKSDGCHRSAYAWPRLLAKGSLFTLRIDGLFACSGATTPAVVWETFKGEQPQLSQSQALSSQPELVTLTIGGNDIGFADILTKCVTYPRCAGRIQEASTFIRDRLPAILTSTYKLVDARTGDARVIVTGYPGLMNPEARAAGLNCKWSSRDKVMGLTALASQLDQVMGDTARAANLEYNSTLTALKGHEMCTRDSWVYPLNLTGGQLRGHPTYQGQQALANDAAAYLAARPMS